jgi:ABC-2 type transport system ATP-binding protein
MADHAIAVTGLTYQYGDKVAVDHIDFVVAEGEIIGFLGPNGAGKTTTVKMLTGQLSPREGKAEVLGLDIAREAHRVQSQIGVCFEQTNLYEKMSAAANLRLFARLFGVQSFDPEELLAKVGLAGKGRDRAGTFSKGMKQRLMVARAMVSHPRILFLDEPTSGLDPASAQDIRRLIQAERDRGATIFLTTHDMVEADKLADRVAFMNQGRIVAFDTPHALKQRHGRRALRAQVSSADGGLAEREVRLDEPGTAEAVRRLFADEKVVTVHSAEATLEDIFIALTGRGLEA